jgi:hypothetical protein
MMILQIFKPHRLRLRRLPRQLRQPLHQPQHRSRVSWTFCRPPQLLLRQPLTDLRSLRRRHNHLARSIRCSRLRRKRDPARRQLLHPRMQRRLRWAPRVQLSHHLWAPLLLCLVNLRSQAEGLTTCGRCPSALPAQASPLHQLALERAYGTWRRRRRREGYGVHRASRGLRRRIHLDRS